MLHIKDELISASRVETKMWESTAKSLYLRYNPCTDKQCQFPECVKEKTQPARNLLVFMRKVIHNDLDSDSEILNESGCESDCEPHFN